jgi:hypothetical protein
VIRQLVLLCIVVLLLAACGGSEPAEPEPGTAESDLQLTSSAFAEGESIPEVYSCNGEDISPSLAWEGVPEGTESFALIVDDPDAPVGTWVHWVLFDIPGDRRELPEGVPAQAEVPEMGRHGENSWGRTDYGGPCPPSGTHTYVFKLYALDTTLELETGTKKEALLDAMEGHLLARTELRGEYP